MTTEFDANAVFDNLQQENETLKRLEGYLSGSWVPESKDIENTYLEEVCRKYNINGKNNTVTKIAELGVINTVSNIFGTRPKLNQKVSVGPGRKLTLPISLPHHKVIVEIRGRGFHTAKSGTCTDKLYGIPKRYSRLCKIHKYRVIVVLAGGFTEDEEVREILRAFKGEDLANIDDYILEFTRVAQRHGVFCYTSMGDLVHALCSIREKTRR